MDQGRVEPALRPDFECAIEVHKHLGPGLVERLYEDAPCREPSLQSLHITHQDLSSLSYKGAALEGPRLEVVVDCTLIIEVKAIKSALCVHLARLVSYLRAAETSIGLLLRFNVPRMVDGVHHRALTPAPLSPSLSPL